MDKESMQNEQMKEEVLETVENEMEQVKEEDATTDETVVNRGKTPVESLYDHIPLTYKQVDRITKFAIALLIIVLAIAILDARLR